MGSFDFIRVDFPAARMMAVDDIRKVNAEIGTRNLELPAVVQRLSFHVQRFAIAMKLPRKDSNLDKEYQKLLCYRYTTG